jgi:hypothetical protein
MNPASALKPNDTGAKESQALAPFSLQLLVGCAVIWLFVCLVEENTAIFILFVLLAALGLGLCSRLAYPRTAVNLFAVGLTVRTIAACLAWYLSKGTGTAFWTGTNPDSDLFFQSSLLPLSQAISATLDPGWIWINYHVTQFTQYFGDAHYLSNVQLPLIFGALFPVAVFAFAAKLKDEPVARFVGWLLVFQPAAIAYSTGLLRDTAIGAIGWFLVVLFLKDSSFKGRLLFPDIMLAVVCGICLWGLRLQSLIVFVFIAALFLVKGRKDLSNNWSRLIMGMVILGVLVTFYEQFSQRIEGFLMLGSDIRAGGQTKINVLDPQGLSTQITEAGSWLSFLLMAPFSLIMPFPFYGWDPGWVGGQTRLVDILLGLGGLLNQLLMGFYLVAIFTYVRRRQWFKLFYSFIILFGTGALNVAGAGQIRYMLFHLYPFFFLAAADAWVQLRRYPDQFLNTWFLWLASLFCLYSLYWEMKSGLGTQTALLIFFPAILLLTIALFMQVRIGSYQEQR